MSNIVISPETVLRLRELFGDRLGESVPMAPYTSARIGGLADFLLEVHSADDLADATRQLWDEDVPFRILGGGSNILVSDRGVREVVVLNRARKIHFFQEDEAHYVKAESGAVLGTVARLAGDRGWSGLEWGATVPGTVGGAVVGNAGAYGEDMASVLKVAEILQQDGCVEEWPLERLQYGYRDSILKRNPGPVILSTILELSASTVDACKTKIGEYSQQRTQSQPAGASMGSMFKNPPDDFAGRLIDAVGLKGIKQGAVSISSKHANFFMNEGEGTADQVWTLIQTAREKVKEKFGVSLELEIELIGEWPEKEAVLFRRGKRSS
ncbi:MAG TPA: UDP-N-acetylmuramate dehydrogenase [Anaerolineales bacterium]|nr:UDP-N-acetylmuramate dehydrogenase [Anaerolineales bacterium]